MRGKDQGKRKVKSPSLVGAGAGAWAWTAGRTIAKARSMTATRPNEALGIAAISSGISLHFKKTRPGSDAQPRDLSLSSFSGRSREDERDGGAQWASGRFLLGCFRARFGERHLRQRILSPLIATTVADEAKQRGAKARNPQRRCSAPQNRSNLVNRLSCHVRNVPRIIDLANRPSGGPFNGLLGHQ